LSSGHIARCILHRITAQCETDSSSGFGLLPVVDRSTGGSEYSMIPGRTDCENGQRVGVGTSGLASPAPAGCQPREANSNQQGSAGLWH
jgi:hypothetical protein